MILNALDEVLFWEDITLLSAFMKNIVAKYYPHDPENYFKEKERFMEENIPDKSDFMRRLEYYISNGAPIWVSGRSSLSKKKKVSPWYSCFSKYGFSDEETGVWLERLKLYSNPEQIEELAAEKRLRLRDKKDDSGVWTILVLEKY